MQTIKPGKTILLSFLMLVVVAAFYRILPNREMGFAPHLAMAIFGGAVIRDVKWAFALPIFSIFISDVIYQILYLNGLSLMPGFYEGQITNYILFAGTTLLGFMMKKISVRNIIVFSVLSTVAFYLLSNFFVWQSGAGFARPKTASGLLLCYQDGLPFLYNSLRATLIFSAILFGSWLIIFQKYYSDRKLIKQKV